MRTSDPVKTWVLVALGAAVATTVVFVAWPSGDDAAPSISTPNPSTTAHAPALSSPPAPPLPRPATLPVTLSTAVNKEIVVDGQPRPFIERRYEPELLLEVASARRPDVDEASPEAAVTGLYSAFVNGDWDWALAAMDPAARAWQLAQDTPRERFLEAWQHEYGSHRFLLTRRIDIPGYAILYMRRDDRPADAPLSLVPLPFAVDKQGRWRFTQALRDHPVYGYDGLRDPHEVRVVGP